MTELLWYNWKTIKHYKDNLYIDNTLTKQWSERESSFITIPYNYIKEFSGIKHFKLKFNKNNSYIKLLTKSMIFVGLQDLL